MSATVTWVRVRHHTGPVAHRGCSSPANAVLRLPSGRQQPRHSSVDDRTYCGRVSKLFWYWPFPARRGTRSRNGLLHGETTSWLFKPSIASTHRRPERHGNVTVQHTRCPTTCSGVGCGKTGVDGIESANVREGRSSHPTRRPFAAGGSISFTFTSSTASPTSWLHSPAAPVGDQRSRRAATQPQTRRAGGESPAQPAVHRVPTCSSCIIDNSLTT